MKTLSTILFSVFLGYQGFSQTLEQNIFGTTGESFMNNVAQVSYTVGELSVNTEWANSVTLTQGFHQSMLSVTEITEIGVYNEIDVFPNPTHEYVMVHFHGFINESRTIQVFDLLGQEVLEEELSSNSDQIKINLADLRSGQYILTISSESGSLINSYRIVKLN